MVEAWQVDSRLTHRLAEVQLDLVDSRQAHRLAEVQLDNMGNKWLSR